MKVATLGELGRLVDGVVRGPNNLEIAHALPLQADLPAGCVTLVDKRGVVDPLLSSGAVAAVVPVGFPEVAIGLIECARPHEAFERIIQHLRPGAVDARHGVHPTAVIDASATVGIDCMIGPGVSIGANSVVGARARIHAGAQIMANCQVGDDCELFPSAVLYPGTRLGHRCILHAGVVLGAYGFGYRTVSAQHQRTAQLGWVELGDDVEIGANTTVDRGTYGPTRIGDGSKLDNLVMIGHNCQIGKHNLICAHVGIAGSCSTGDYVVLGGQVGVKDHTQLGDRCMVSAQSGVMHNIPSGEVWGGTPAVPTKKFMLTVAAVSRLPDMRSDLRRLEQETDALRQQVSELQKLLGASQPDRDLRDRAA